jgi:hypothetical protein
MIKSGMSSPVSYDLQGQGGGVVIDSTSGSVIGTFRWIQVVNDAELDAISTSENLTDFSKLTGITIPAGVGIGGRFLEIAVTSGVVIAYYA